ncbi:hypothetical protein PCASD_24658 [Puccinia coronata f. sp. avenae]|uniref:Uncharacterized protein n=1 Tax=Puccinia coronata f. sp. avenae TaxID=200324 RepID=A0A2N5TMF2_9BASI|nr:hypothetical protein PCASD_24658 [Puccinia coronata f. sp. avenae]
MKKRSSSALLTGVEAHGSRNWVGGAAQDSGPRARPIGSRVNQPTHNLVEPLIIRATTMHHLEYGWIESVYHINTKPFSSPSTIIDRVGITVREGTPFAHYLREISLVAKPPPPSSPFSEPSPGQPEKHELRVKVSWHPESAPDAASLMDTASTPTNGPSNRRLISTLGTLWWRAPLHVDNDDDGGGVLQREMVAWLVYMTPGRSQALILELGTAADHRRAS